MGAYGYGGVTVPTNGISGMGLLASGVGGGTPKRVEGRCKRMNSSTQQCCHGYEGNG